MYYNSIYSQLFNFIPRYRFEKIVKNPVATDTVSILQLGNSSWLCCLLKFPGKILCVKLKTLCLPTTNTFITSAWKPWQNPRFLKRWTAVIRKFSKHYLKKFLIGSWQLLRNWIGSFNAVRIKQSQPNSILEGMSRLLKNSWDKKFNDISFFPLEKFFQRGILFLI